MSDGEEPARDDPGDGDVADAPGGSADRIEKSFRGISQRLAVDYLQNLGGEHVSGEADGEGEDVVEGDGWTATLTTEKVGVGATLQLTEVTVVFEGSDLGEIVEQFSRKAMRAGG